MTRNSLTLINSRNERAGTLMLDHINIVQQPSFVDYLRSGWGISMLVAIDFTGSNGELTDPTSLHFLNAFN